MGFCVPQATPVRQGTGRDRGTEKHRPSVSPLQGPASPQGMSLQESHRKLASLMHKAVLERSGSSRNHTTRPLCEPCLERLRKEVLGPEYPYPGIPPGLLGLSTVETASVYPEPPAPGLGLLLQVASLSGPPAPTAHVPAVLLFCPGFPFTHDLMLHLICPQNG